MFNLIVLEKILKLEYFALWQLWKDLNIDWTTLENIHERLLAKHYQHDIEFRFWDFNNGNFEGVYSFICDCVDAIFVIDITINSDKPLSTHCQRLTGDCWNVIDWAGDLNNFPAIIKHKKTGLTLRVH